MSAINIQGVAEGAFTKLAASVANCSDTTDETTVVTVTVPKNTWRDGEIVNVWFMVESLQNSGGAVNLTLKAKCNAGSITVVNASSQSNSATMGKSERGFAMMRSGADVFFSPANNDVTLNDYGGMFFPVTTELITGGVSVNHHSANIFTTVDFTADVVITFTAQWASANANTYFNVKSCIASKANR